MPAARDDYLLRLIAQAAAMLRRLREQLAGGTSGAEVARDASAAIGSLLGPQRLLLERLDATSAAQIVGNNDTVNAWVGLLRLQAEAEAAAGNAEQSARLGARANALAEAMQRASQVALSRNMHQPGP